METAPLEAGRSLRGAIIKPMAKRRKLTHRAKQFFLPNAGNGFRPKMFAKQSVAAIAIALLLVEVAYLVQLKVVMLSEGFAASVLPSALYTLTNADRAAYALSTLTEDPSLARAAQAKADDMARGGYFAHVSPDGTTFRQILDGAGYSYTYAGENLAVDFEESVDVERAWMNSPTHRANILKSEYTHVGFGIARGVYQGREVTFIAQFLAAKPRAGESRVPVEEKILEVPTREPAIIVQSDAQPQVLGDESRPSPSHAAAMNSVAVLATSPSQLVWYMVTAFTALVAVLYSITVLAHARNKYLHTEILLGGIIILVMGLGILAYNASRGTGEVPAPSQAASVSALL